MIQTESQKASEEGLHQAVFDGTLAEGMKRPWPDAEERQKIVEIICRTSLCELKFANDCLFADATVHGLGCFCGGSHNSA